MEFEPAITMNTGATQAKVSGHSSSSSSTSSRGKSFLETVLEINASDLRKGIVKVARETGVKESDSISEKVMIDDTFAESSEKLKAFASGMYDFEGTTVESVIEILTAHYIKGFAKKNMNDVYLACMIAIKLSFHQTKKVLDDDFSNLEMFKEMRIEGRDGSMTTWKENKELNATAVRLLGQVLVQAGSEVGNDKCVAIVKQRGTMFRPVDKPDAELTEYQRICKVKYIESGRKWMSVYERYRGFFAIFWKHFGTFEGATGSFDHKVLYGMLNNIANDKNFKERTNKK